jgi:hypothetical protein
VASTRVLIGLGALLGVACGEDQAQGPPPAAGATAGSSGIAGTAGSAGSSMGGTTSDGGGSAGTGASSGSGGSSGTGASSGSGGTIGSDASPRAACRHYLETACRRIAECDGTTVLSSCLGAMDRCPDYSFSPGSTRTVASLIACAEQWTTFDCTQATNGGSPPCATPGTRQTGETCAFASQCQSQRCGTIAGVSSCGTCKAPVPDGSPCSELSDCALGHVCSAGVCGTPAPRPPRPPPAAAGAPCTGRCVEGYACGPDAVAEPRCVPLPGPGSPCIQERCREGAYCSFATRQCLTEPGVGEPCGQGTSGAVVCVRGARCGADASNNPVCLARTPIGSVCEYKGYCVEGAECLGNGSVCLRIREEGETCSDANDHCTEGTACTNGRCVASGNLGLFESLCRR